MNGSAFVAVLHHGPLVFLDGDGVSRGHAAGAGSLTQSGAHPAGEFGIAVGSNEPLHRQIPLALINKVIPLGDQVVQGASAEHTSQQHTALAEGDTTVHTPGALGLLLIGMQGDVKFVKVFGAFLRGQLKADLPVNFHKSCRLSHCRDPPYLPFFMA